MDHIGIQGLSLLLGDDEAKCMFAEKDIVRDKTVLGQTVLVLDTVLTLKTLSRVSFPNSDLMVVCAS